MVCVENIQSYQYGEIEKMSNKEEIRLAVDEKKYLPRAFPAKFEFLDV
jgi:hypothetical protein